MIFDDERSLAPAVTKLVNRLGMTEFLDEQVLPYGTGKYVEEFVFRDAGETVIASLWRVVEGKARVADTLDIGAPNESLVVNFGHSGAYEESFYTDCQHRTHLIDMCLDDRLVNAARILKSVERNMEKSQSSSAPDLHDMVL